MGNFKIKNIRVVFSLLIFSLTVLALLGHVKISQLISETLFNVQFIPAFIQFVEGTGIAFLFLVLLTLCFGRVYCSFLCPLGVLQDLMIRLSLKIGIKKQHVRLDNFIYFQYTVLILTIVTVIFGSFAFINLFDPYTVFAKIAAHLFKPLVLFFNNILVEIVETFDIYSISIKRQNSIPFHVLAVTLIFLTGILFLSVFKARLYCNSICPVGLILGMMSRVSFYKFHMDKEKCRHCTLCERVCKAGCIDVQNLTIDNSRCVGCFNCLDVCDKHLISYTHRTAENKNHPVWVRRHFLLNSVVVGSAVLSACTPFRLEKTGFLPGKAPVMPPGSLGFDHFTKTCTACHLCVSVCPTQVLKPTLMGYGLSGLMLPQLSFQKARCDFNCNACGKSCPTGAVTSLPLKEKQLTQIGTASLNKELCVVHIKKKHCGACGEACPTHAIFPVEDKKVIFPEINLEYCIGCGACEHACPTDPNAIVVSSVLIHKKVKTYKPDRKPELKLIPQKQGFPF
ncbi:MAG: 4Fe-4S dicluster domain-containing protein [Desulfobacteraceae bacterium]|nr:4Fe-4S dicluster domain-containing protein [Desulfobacteraceae bacterium]